jgi:signal transduction histidine kinase
VPARDLNLFTFFVAGALSLAILIAAVLGALIVAQQRRLALERAQSRRIFIAQEEERSRVARELHDDALQRVAMIRHELDTATELDREEMAGRIASASEELDDLGDVLRTAAHHLHPSVVEKAGLPRALGSLAEEFKRVSGLDVRLAVPAADLVVRPVVGVAAYRIAQEALRNVVKHAAVREADLILDEADGELTLRVVDRGKGAEPEEIKGAGLGVIAMRQRAEAVGGKLTVESAVGTGTTVTATFSKVES